MDVSRLILVYLLHAYILQSTCDKNTKRILRKIKDMKKELKKLSGKLSHRNKGCSGCPEFSVRINNSCYIFQMRKKTWHQAKANCQNMGAQLAVIDTKNEQKKLAGYLSRNISPDIRGFYIAGYNRFSNHSAWAWDGNVKRPIERTEHWCAATLNGTYSIVFKEGRPMCLEMHSKCFGKSWAWHGIPCSEARPFICEISEG